MSQNECKEIAIPNCCNDETKDTKKAVELNIVILVEEETPEGSSQQQQRCPPPCCPPPCCKPACCVSSCCMLRQCRPCCMPPCQACPCPCMRPPCPPPCPPPCGQRAPCGNVGRVKSQTACCQTPTHGSCQTDPCQRPKVGCGSSQTDPYNKCATTPCGVQSVPRSQTAGCQCMPLVQSCRTAQVQNTCQTQTASPCPCVSTPPCQGDQIRIVKGKKCKIRPVCGEAPEPICCTNAREMTCQESEGAQGSMEPELAPPRSKRVKNGEGRRSSNKRHKRPSIPPDQLDYTNCAGPQTSFVKYFLKFEGGAPYVTNLAENKLEYEKSSKEKLQRFPKHIRHEAQDFFMKIVDTVNTPTPDTQRTEIKHFHVMKYLNPIIAALSLEAPHESHSIQKYQQYILSVVKIIEQKQQQKETVNPACVVEIETQLLAGIVCRFFPIFILIKDLLVSLVQAGQPNATLNPQEFLKQLKKLIMCVYVEIQCIDDTFTNILTRLVIDVQAQENFRQQLALRKKHARHATKWAARCLATILLYYFMIDMK